MQFSAEPFDQNARKFHLQGAKVSPFLFSLTLSLSLARARALSPSVPPSHFVRLVETRRNRTASRIFPDLIMPGRPSRSERGSCLFDPFGEMNCTAPAEKSFRKALNARVHDNVVISKMPTLNVRARVSLDGNAPSRRNEVPRANYTAAEL